MRRNTEALTTLIPLSLLAVLVLVPVGFLVYGSLRSAGPGAPNATLTAGNWSYATGDWGFRYLSNSLKLGVATAAIAMPIGTALAWLVARTDMPARRLLGTGLLVPLVFSPLLMALAWRGLAAPNSGLINVMARELFGREAPLFNVYSMTGLVLVLVLHYTPYVYIAVRPALAAMDRDMEEASQVLGARPLRTLRRVTLPLLAPAIVGSGLLVGVLASENFSAVAVLGGQAKFLTIPYGIYESIAAFPANPGRGSALGLILLAVTSAGMAAYLWSIRKTSRFVTVSGKGGRRPLRILSPAGKALALLLVGGFVFVGVVLPYVMLAVGSFSTYFTVEHFSLDLLTLEHYQNLFSTGTFLRSLRNTALLVLIGATAASLLGAFSGWVAVRGKGQARKAVDYLTTMPIMIPGVALGLGMFWAYVFLPIGIYGTLTILVVAYITRFMGHAARIVSSALLQCSPDLESAARVLGASKVKAFRQITLRLIRQAVGAAWILVAIFVALEIPASIMLYTGASVPASVQVYLMMEGGVVSHAFAGGFTLATVTLVFTLIAQKRFGIFERI